MGIPRPKTALGFFLQKCGDYKNTLVERIIHRITKGVTETKERMNEKWQQKTTSLRTNC